MKTLWRWILIKFCCEWGDHAPVIHVDLPGNVLVTECPRCHQSVKSHHGQTDYVFNDPPAWDVARGLYDTEQAQP